MTAPKITASSSTASKGVESDQPVWLAARIASERTGKGARIALIDSGVESGHPWFADAVIHNKTLARVGKQYQVVDDEPHDGSGHGTACAGIIHRMAPAAEIVSLRALGTDGRCSRNALISALHFCIRERFDVVNLSLGIDVPRKAPLKVTDHLPLLRMYEAADAAATVGVVLVASGPNVQHFRTYPGRFKSLIGVGRAAFEDWEQLQVERTRDYEILAPGSEILAPTPGGGSRRWTGTCFACPFVTAHIARLRAANPTLSVSAVRVALRALARRSLEQRTSEQPGQKQRTDSTASPHSGAS